MSWTVTQDHSQEDQHQDDLHKGIQDIISSVVDDDDTVVTPAKGLPQSGSTGNLASSESVNLFTASSSSGPQQPTGFMSQGAQRPSLNPNELQSTPVKEGGMDGFTSWVRNQQGTPNSSRASPTPTGPYGLSQPAQSPLSAARNSNPSQGNTPMKFGDSPLQPQGGAGSSNNQLEAISEQRRRLLREMEQLQIREAEIRNAAGDPSYEQQYDANGQPIAPPSPQQQLTLENVRGRIYETAKDQHGCRFLQRLLDQGAQESVEAAQIILGEILQHIPELMTDQYANFLVQKLFDMMPHDVRYTVAQVAAQHLCVISLTAHGTFSVQKLIETIATREEMEVVQVALKADVVQLVKDVHGNHVIQKVLQRFEHQDTQFIYDALTSDCIAIATNKQGCCVLQRCLEYASEEQRTQMVSSIVQSALTLVQDPFGNYVVQYVLDGKDQMVNDAIGELFLPHIVMLSTNKFSSNVVEKVIRGCTVAVKEKYVIILFDQNILMRLLRDDYGNYVVQTALTEAPYHHAEQLIMCIRPILHHIRNAPYAKKLEAKMDLCLKKKNGGFSPNRGMRDHHHGGGHGGGGNPYHQHHHHQPHSPVQQHHSHGGSPSHHHGGFPNQMNMNSPMTMQHQQHSRGGGGGMNDNPFTQQVSTPGSEHRPFRATAAPWSPQLSMEQ